MMIKAIAHICIVAQDLTQTEHFYCTGLGLKKKFNFIREEILIGYYIEINDHKFIEVFAAEAPTTGQTPVKHFCLEVEDIDAVAERLKENGVEAREKKMGSDQSWQIWCKDPSGIDMEFHQYTAKSSQLTGESCIVTW